MDIMHSLGLPAEPPPAQKKAPDRHFHWFPYLHQDVRLLIWEAAMRPQPSKNYNATHRFRVHTWEGDNPSLLETSDVGYKSPPLYGSRVTRGLDDHKMREPMSLCPEVLKSVVHWDYGLWKACIESRWVISRRFRWKYWEEMKKSVLKDLQTVPKEIREPFTMEAAWQNEDLLMQNGYPERHSKWYKDFASVVSIDGMYNNIVAIHPARDLFIMEDERWMHELARQLTDTEQEDKAVQLFRENAISPTSDGSPILGNIGFNNPRGLFLLLLHLTVVRIIGGVRLWLIDETFDPCRTRKTEKDAEKEVEEEKRDRKVFYRYGKEDLVEVDVKPNVMRVLIDNASCILATSCGFLEYLSRDPIAGNSAFNPDPRAKPLNIWSCVGVLVPRSRTLME
ncbi:hypothetical protein CEK26_005044 [Fusarium fujikuroi]|nr:hypothetical protein CEK26_005044 [Fusarium fujikuroi]